MTGVAKTLLDVAAELGRPLAFTEALLRDEQAHGTIERLDDGRWALTSQAPESLPPSRDLPDVLEDRP